MFAVFFTYNRTGCCIEIVSWPHRCRPKLAALFVVDAQQIARDRIARFDYLTWIILIRIGAPNRAAHRIPRRAGRQFWCGLRAWSRPLLLDRLRLHGGIAVAGLYSRAFEEGGDIGGAFTALHAGNNYHLGRVNLSPALIDGHGVVIMRWIERGNRQYRLANGEPLLNLFLDQALALRFYFLP